jgi:hypothetical protein
VTLDPHRESGRTAQLERITRAAGAEVWHSAGNRHKKTGNLNGALGRLLPDVSDQDGILVQDADTYPDPHFIEVTRRKMGQGYGAVVGNFRGRSGGGLCGAFQRNEFARYARDTARKKGKVLCLTGTACLFRAGALRGVLDARKSGRLPPAEGVYDTKAPTEDNELALWDAGFEGSRSAPVLRAFTAWVLGYVSVELRAVVDNPREPDPAFRLGLYRMPSEELPRLRATAPALAERGGPEGLAAGLDALLDRFVERGL